MTQAEAAKYLFVASARRIRELVAAGAIPNPQRATEDELRQAYIKHLQAVAGSHGTASLTDARARREAAAAEKAEIELAELQERKLDAHEVRDSLRDLFKHISRRARAIPSSAITAIGLTPEQSRKLLAMIDRVLDDLSRYKHYGPEPQAKRAAKPKRASKKQPARRSPGAGRAARTSATRT